MKRRDYNNTIQAKNIFNKELIALIAFIIIGTVLRFFRLSFQSYTPDEAGSLGHLGAYFQSLSRGFFGDPPLYEFLLYSWVKLFGHSEAATRSLSAIFSILTIPVLYLAVKNFLNKKTALFSVFLLTFSAYHIYYAQEARMYALSGFLTVTSSLFFIKALKSDKKINWIIYAITSALTFYAHYSFLFVFLAQSIMICLTWEKYKIRLSHWLSSLAIVGVMSLPWIVISLIPRFIIPTFIEKQDYFWIHKTTIEVILYSFVCFLWGSEGGGTLSYFRRYYWLSSKIALIFALSIILINIFLILRQQNNFKEKTLIIFFILWLVLPILMIYLISVGVHPIYQVRYVDVSIFAFFILIAYSLNKIKPVILKVMLLVVFLIPNIIALNYYYRFPVKPPIRDIAAFLKTKHIFNDKILVYDINEIGVFEYYCPKLSENMDLFMPEKIGEIIRGGYDFWLINPDKWGKIKDMKRKFWIGDDFNNIYYLVKKERFGDIGVFNFRRISSACLSGKFPVSEKLCAQGICLPSISLLQDSQIESTVSLVKRYSI